MELTGLFDDYSNLPKDCSDSIKFIIRPDDLIGLEVFVGCSQIILASFVPFLNLVCPFSQHLLSNQVECPHNHSELKFTRSYRHHREWLNFCLIF